MGGKYQNIPGVGYSDPYNDLSDFSTHEGLGRSRHQPHSCQIILPRANQWLVQSSVSVESFKTKFKCKRFFQSHTCEIKGEKKQECAEKEPFRSNPTPRKGSWGGANPRLQGSLEMGLASPSGGRTRAAVRKFVLSRSDQTLLPCCLPALVWSCLKRSWS